METIRPHMKPGWPEVVSVCQLCVLPAMLHSAWPVPFSAKLHKPWNLSLICAHPAGHLVRSSR